MLIKNLKKLKIQQNLKITLVKRLKLTDNDFPVLDSVGNFVGTSYLRKTNTTDDEDKKSGDILHSLLALVLMPVTVPCTGNRFTTYNTYYYQ